MSILRRLTVRLLQERIIRQVAKIQCELFRITCPQVIGSISLEKSSPGPLIIVSPIAPTKPFGNLSSYIEWLFENIKGSNRMGSTTKDRAAGLEVLDRVKELLPRLISKLSPCSSRIVVCHRELTAGQPPSQRSRTY
jgi:hypothetical protein